MTRPIWRRLLRVAEWDGEPLDSASWHSCSPVFVQVPSLLLVCLLRDCIVMPHRGQGRARTIPEQPPLPLPPMCFVHLDVCLLAIPQSLCHLHTHTSAQEKRVRERMHVYAPCPWKNSHFGSNFYVYVQSCGLAVCVSVWGKEGGKIGGQREPHRTEEMGKWEKDIPCAPTVLSSCLLTVSCDSLERAGNRQELNKRFTLSYSPQRLQVNEHVYSKIVLFPYGGQISILLLRSPTSWSHQGIYVYSAALLDRPNPLALSGLCFTG